MATTTRETRRVDGIGCAGLLLLIFLLGSAALSVLQPDEPAAESPSPTPSWTPAATQVAASSATATRATFTPVPTLTASPLPLPSATTSPTLAPSIELPAVTLPPATATNTATPLPLPTPIPGLTQTVRVPILMYHYVSEPPEEADIYREDLSISPEAFRAQLQYLADNGYTTIDLYDLVLATSGKIQLPPRPVILTFDDGYLDHYTNAFPLLREFGFSGTFFIITDYVDNGNPGHMSWPMIEEMAAAGMRMESHSKTHPDLSEADDEQLVWQILGSQQTLAAHIGYTPRFFCYPGGRYNEETIAVLEELDFWGAVTTAGGKWHRHEERYEWTRLRIRYTTSLPLFIDLVNPDNG